MDLLCLASATLNDLLEWFPVLDDTG